MSRNLSGLLAFIFLIVSLPLRAQDPESLLEKYSKENPTEKISIHFDKSAYISGETIWFKAYLHDGYQPTSRSYNFFIELIGPKGEAIERKRYPVSGATAFGNFDLSDSLETGEYTLIAFTPLLLNAGKDHFFEKKINIYNRKKISTASSKKEEERLVIQFFPEGGNMVRGVPGTIAFKATNQWGIPVDVTGIIKLEDGTKVADFTSFHDGMGRFTLRPSVGTKYKAYVDFKNKTYTTSLNDPLASGVIVKIDDEPTGKMFTISRSARDAENYDTLLLLAQINQHIAFKQTIILTTETSVRGHINTETLPSGILGFTVFDNNGLPLIERLAFVNNREYVSKGDLKLNKVNLGNRGINNIDVSFNDSLQRSLSVSVIDIENWQAQEEGNIYSDIFLSSELKGYIHRPSWYFREKTDSVTRALDLLMLTNGWRRFSWEKVLKPVAKIDQSIKEPSFLLLSGTVSEAGTTKPVIGGKLNLVLRSADSIPQFLSIDVAENGKFLMDSLVYFDSTSVMVTYKNKKGKDQNVSVVFDSDSLESISKNFSLKLSPASELITDLPVINTDYLSSDKLDDKKYKLLTEVIVNARKGTPTEELEEKYVQGQFETASKRTVDLVNKPHSDPSLSVVDYIRNNFSPLRIVTRAGKRIFIDPRKFSLGNARYFEVTVFMDNNPSTIDQLQPIPVRDVALIKFYNTGFYGGETASPAGALIVYTKNSDEYRSKDFRSNIGAISINGYSVTRDFYQPEYDTAQLKQLIDNRITLYWNPLLFTDGQSPKASFSFNANDIGKKYKVTVQGFDGRGGLIFMESVIAK